MVLLDKLIKVIKDSKEYLINAGLGYGVWGYLGKFVGVVWKDKEGGFCDRESVICCFVRLIL